MPWVDFNYRPWTEPPLFEPDWIVLDLRLNVCRNDQTVWGGLEVRDGDTGDVLAVRAQAWGTGAGALAEGLEQLYEAARDHMEPGGPFPT